MTFDQNAIIVLGGDGFCGWPIALNLSSQGYNVTIVDNLSRRTIDRELHTSPLFPIQTIEARCAAWKEKTGRVIEFRNFDIAHNYVALRETLAEIRPKAIVHLAEQRSAPYSTLNATTRSYTVANNIGTTHSVLIALQELSLDSHLVHLGSIGIFGYATAGITLPEGYVSATIKGADGRTADMDILYPGNPVSLYHLTKAQNQLLCQHYITTSNLRISELNQGIVWGSTTPETLQDPRLATRYDIDAVYGTVVNRFLRQAAIGDPLSIYGTGGQTRGFIHLRDVTQCVRIAVENPPRLGDRLLIFNQVTETLSVENLAKQVSRLTGAKIAYTPNPREEPESNEFDVAAMRLKDLGLAPTLFSNQLAKEAKSVFNAMFSH